MSVLASLLALGLLMGVRHALEADHVAAVASLAARSRTARETVRLAVVWGLGHAAMLIALAGLLAALDASVPPALGRSLEALAGLVLAALGMDVLLRLRRRRVHFHLHLHGDGMRHIHAHGHGQEPPAAHDPQHHPHEHAPASVWRAVVVGGVHGLAGSSALVLLAAQAGRSAAHSVAYVAVFGLGSVLGMALFSLAIALPLRVRSRHLERARGGLEAALGAGSVALGLWIATRAALGPLS